MECIVKMTNNCYVVKFNVEIDPLSEIILTDFRTRKLNKEIFHKIDVFEPHILTNCPNDSNVAHKFKIQEGKYEIKTIKDKHGHNLMLKISKPIITDSIDCIVGFQLKADSLLILTAEAENELAVEEWIGSRINGKMNYLDKDPNALIDDLETLLAFWMTTPVDGLYNCTGKFNEKEEMVFLEIDLLNV